MQEFTEGIHGIYKDKGMTSHDVIALLRKKTGIKKIGHAGTLDPLAEGVLVVAIGKEYTKQIAIQVQKEKEYIAEVMFGYTSTTDDNEGKKVMVQHDKIPDKEDIEHIIKEYVGKIKQVPPLFSAIKVKGKRAYKAARAGEKIKLEAREVLVKEIEIIKYTWPILKIRVVTGSGVYIRSLARDIGDDLGVGGYLDSLQRTRVGEYLAKDAIHIEK